MPDPESKKEEIYKEQKERYEAFFKDFRVYGECHERIMTILQKKRQKGKNNNEKV